MPAAPRSGGLPGEVEAVLLDAGGVLLDLDFAFIRRIVCAHEVDVSEAQLQLEEARSRLAVDCALRAGGAAGEWRDFFYLLLGRVGVPVAEHDAIIDTLREAHQRVGLWTVATPRGPETVAELKALGLRLAVVSNAEGQVARDLDSAGYRGAFETVIDSHVVGVCKPDPAIFRLALDHLRVGAERAVYVGDMPGIDVAGARAAGVWPILLDCHDFYEGFDVQRIRTLDQLPTILGRES